MCWIMEKAREFQKNIYFCFIDYAKGFDCVSSSFKFPRANHSFLINWHLQPQSLTLEILVEERTKSFITYS